jgi:hypothetical protein
METKAKGTRAGTKNRTWCGVPIDLYRRRKAELSKEEFRVWWLKKTGRQLCLRENKRAPADPAVIASEMLSASLKRLSNLEEMLSSTLQQRDAALASAERYRQMLTEKKSWISRLFNLKG